jgi:hypothetical protein
MNNPETMYFLVSVLYLIQFGGLILMIMDKCLRYMRKYMFITNVRVFLITMPIHYMSLTSHSVDSMNTYASSSLQCSYATIQFIERAETHNSDSDSDCDSGVHDATDEHTGYYADTNVDETDDVYETNSEDDDNHDDSDSEDDEDDDYGTDPEDYRLIMSQLSHEDREKEHGHYYIGMSFLHKNTEARNSQRCSCYPLNATSGACSGLCNSEGIYLMNSTISARTFLAYSYSRVHAYVRNTSCYYVRRNTQIEIMQLCIHADGVYEVVLKTYWLRIVQRRWKNIYKERQRILRLRSSIHNQEYFRRHGKYMEGSRHFPSLRGALRNPLHAPAVAFRR